jgi:hypothetical protein
MIATQEFVVPRSIPIILPIVLLRLPVARGGYSSRTA